MIWNRLRVILALALAILFVTAGVALAAEVYVVEDTTFFTGTTAAPKASGTLETGTKVKVISYNSTWARLEVDGKSGFVKTEDLAVKKDYSGKTVYLKESADLFKEFGSSTRVRTLEKGEAVKLYATAGAWAYIKAGSDSGIVKTDLLSTEKPEDEAENTAAVTAYVKNKNAKAYKSATSSSKVLARLAVNDTVEVLSVTGKWCKVKKNGYMGYMKKTDLSTKKISVTVYEDYTGYVKKDDTPVYKSCSESAEVLTRYGINQAVEVAAYNDDWCGIRYEGGYGFMKLSDVSREKQQLGTVKAATGTAKAMDWWKSNIQKILAVDTVFTVTDVETGIAWQEVRSGGTNHADCQPLTAADTAAMRKACGGSWSWNRRAIFVTVNGTNYAASMNGMPHGASSVSGNNFSGHHCIHFTNSRTHDTNKVCSQHKAAIEQAAAATLK